MGLGHRLVEIQVALGRGEITKDLLADLYNNAGRRFDEGKFDDATARLYRLVEMLAQHVLLRDFGIRASDVDPDKVPAPFRETFARIRDERDGKIKVGLVKAHELLRGLGAPLGERFLENERLRSRLGKRNASYLAHGTVPVEEGDCKAFLSEVRSHAGAFVEGFDRRCEELEFPWRRRGGEEESR